MATASLLLTGNVLPRLGERAASAAPAAAVHEGVEGVIALEADWRRLSRAAPDEVAFLGYGFALSAARYHAERGERVLVASVSFDGAVQCILPVALTRQGRVSVAVFLGDPIAQYGDALLGPDAPARSIETALEALRLRADIDVFTFRKVRSDAAIRAAMELEARPQGVAVGAPFAEIAGFASAMAFLQASSSKHKREQARCRRRLEEFGEASFEAWRGESAMPLVREAFELKAQRLSEIGAASPVVGEAGSIRAFERAAADVEDGEGVTAFRLSVGGRTAAIEVGLVRGRRYHAYLGVTDEAYAAASPGRLVMEHVVDWCVAQGIGAVDLLPPAEPYKRLWSTGSVGTQDYALATTWTGALYAGPWLASIRPRLRKLLAMLPPKLRRHAGAAALRAGAR